MLITREKSNGDNKNLGDENGYDCDWLITLANP